MRTTLTALRGPPSSSPPRVETVGPISTSTPQSPSQSTQSASQTSVSSTPEVFSMQTGARTVAAQMTPTAQPAFFNELSRTNIAVYYGQSPGTTANGLEEICADPFVSIVNLAFVPNFFGPNGFPSASFGPACGGPSAAQSSRAPGLQDCTGLGTQIKTCQEDYGKIIMVSLGGYIATSSFNSSAQAVQFASTLWNLFGGGTEYPELRPYGTDVVVDGFDIDNEDHSTLYYDDFVTSLRGNFAKDATGRKYCKFAQLLVHFSLCIFNLRL